MGKEKLKEVILYILNQAGETRKVKLAKLLLFSEIAYFNKTGESLTGLYFVRLKNGPVIAFFDEVLKDNTGTAWNKEIKLIPIFEEGREKEQHIYSSLQKANLPEQQKDLLNKVIKVYGKKTGTELSRLSHSIPAWKYSEPNEPLYVAELAAKDEKEYFALIDLLEDANSEEDDSILAKKIPPAVC